MRVGILCESFVDAPSLRMVVDAVLGLKTESPSASLIAYSWPQLSTVLPVILKQLHFRSDADGLVVIADSNHSSVVEAGTANRLHKLNAMCDGVLKQLPARTNLPPLRVAVGIASPAIEAWWLCKKRVDVNEANWEKGLVTKKDPYSKQELKQWLNGNEIATMGSRKTIMCKAAEELCADLQHLENQFPNGFGSLAKALRAWRSVNS